MKNIFTLKAAGELRRLGKSVLCILLSVSLLFSFPIVLSADETGGGASAQSGGAEYIGMPYAFDNGYGVLPAHLAENTEFYASYDLAKEFYYEVDDDKCTVWYTGAWTGGSVSGKTFHGRGAIIQTSYNDVLIGNVGNYTAEIKPGHGLTGYDPFKNYMESNKHQFKSRLVYLNEVHRYAYVARVAEYAGEYDSNFKTQTVTTDWGVTAIEGNIFYTVKDIMVLTADFLAPSDQITVTGEVTENGATPIIWVDCGEQIRPSAPDTVTYDMLKTLRFGVYLSHKLDSSNKLYVIFEATQISDDYYKIGFTATDAGAFTADEIGFTADDANDGFAVADASALVGGEWRILGLKDISEYGSYPLYTTVGDTGTTVKSPITDIAGNPFALDGTQWLVGKPVYLDAKSPTVASIELNSNAIDGAAEPDLSNLYLSYGHRVELSLILSEQVFLRDGARMSDVKLKWKLKDKNGNYIVTTLKEIQTIKPSGNMSNVTKLVFGEITLAEGMDGEIRPLELIGAESFEDASHNIMDGSISGLSVDKNLTFDNTGPSFETVGDVIRQIEEADKKYLIIKLKINDSQAGIIDTDIQKLSVSTRASVEGLTWQFAITQNSDPVAFGEDGYAVNRVKQYSDFSIPDSGEYFLHLYLKTTAATELLDSVGIQLDFALTDTRGNPSSASVSLTDLGIDRKAPVLVVTPHAVVIERADEYTNTTTFRADVTATDLNGIQRIEYQWTDVGDDPTENGWSIIQSGDRIELTPDSSVDTVTKLLHVRAYDTLGNLSYYQSDAAVFTADLSRLNSRYEIVYDDNKPGGIADVNVLAPVSSNAVYGGYTRVTLTMGGKTYVRVFNLTGENAKASLFDTAAADWYLVEVTGGVYTSVTAEAPDWSYYGTVEVSLAASSSDLTPAVGASSVGDGDTSYRQGNTFEVIYTCLRNDVHDVILSDVTDSAGTEVTLTESGGYKFYKIYRSILGVKYHFTLTNVLMDSLGVTDVDFANSYAQLVVLDAEGNRTGVLAGDPIPLTPGISQSIAFPESEYDSVSGAYGIVIYVAQKSGGLQEFFLEEKLVYDNEPIPEAYGVSEYGRFVEVTYGDTVDMGVKAEEGAYLTTLSVGVTQPSEYSAWGGTVIYIDGKPAFLQTATNALGSTSGGSSMTINISIPTSGTAYLGQTVGKVVGVRVWNAASSGDPYSLPWDVDTKGYLWNYGADTYYRLYLDLAWYANRNDKTVVSAEELAATDVGDLKLALGRNIICYQFIMENGKVSPESRFEINLFDEAPTVEMSMTFEQSFTVVDYLRNDYTYPIKDTEYERLIAQSVYFHIDYAYSPNGALTVYHAYEDPETGEWTVSKVDGSQPIPMMSDSTNGYLGIRGTHSNFTQYTEPVREIILLVDEVGNASAFYPIVSSAYSGDQYEGGQYVSRTYYFEKNTDVGRFDVEVINPDDYEDLTSDGITQILSLNSYFIEKELDAFSIQIDNRDEVMLDAQSGNYGIFGSANDAGLLSFDHDGGWLSYVLPYDPDRTEGEMITHTVTVRGYIGGALAVDIDGNTAERTFEVTAPNVKPTVTLKEDPSIGAVGVTANTYLYAEGITEHEAEGRYYSICIDPDAYEYEEGYELYTDYYSTAFALPIFKDGAYTYGFFDKYGQYYEFPLDVTGLPNDPTVSVSETKLTGEPVTVTVTSTNGGIFNVDTDKLPAGAEVTGNGASELKIVLSDNASFDITCSYATASYDIPISITNIYNKPIVPTVVWSYNPYKVNKADNSYEGEVTATLTDENGSYLTDENGVVPSFTFVPGGETSYVFTGYKNHVGMTGADVTATLPVTLKFTPTDESENDTYAPDIGMTGYAKNKNGTSELNGGYVLTDTSRPEESRVMLSNYRSAYGEENIHSDINGLISQVNWAQKLILNLDIIDENATKIFILSDISAAAPDYTTGTSDGIEGVSIVGRTLQIESNAEFALHVVDSKNNGAKLVISVGMLSDSPASPTLVQALAKNGNEVRIYLSEPSLPGITDLTITNTDITPMIETDALSGFFGKPYLSVTENGAVAVHYSYRYDGQTFTGTVRTTVSCIDTTVPQVQSTVWSANYDGTGVKYTNGDISVQMAFSKTLGEVYVCDKDGNRLTAPDGVTVAFMQDRVTVIYESNAPQIYIKAVSSLNGSLTSIVSLPEITTIDKTAPTLTATVDLNENRTQATVTVTTSETVTWQNGSRDTQFTQRLRENGIYTYRVTDRAGNVAEISVNIGDVITEKLTVTLASDIDGSQIIDPATYHVNIGDTLYVKVNRSAYVTVSGNADGMSITADTWTAITISEDAEGLYPSVLAVDDYGNSAIVQMLRIPMQDRTAPSVMIEKSLISVSLDATRDELTEILRKNVLAKDDTTAADDLIFDFDIPEVTAAGKYAVTYRVKDEAGNVTSATGMVRFYSGEEIVIKVNGEAVERDQCLIVESGTVTIELSYNGEPYKLDMRKGNKSLGQMKNDVTALTDGYTDMTENEMTMQLDPGYHTFLVTTQGRDMYRFVIYIMG